MAGSTSCSVQTWITEYRWLVSMPAAPNSSSERTSEDYDGTNRARRTLAYSRAATIRRRRCH
jgi:hypothetical protein